MDWEAELGERPLSILCGKSKDIRLVQQGKGALCPLSNRKRHRRARRTSKVDIRGRNREDSSLGTFSCVIKRVGSALTKPLCKRNSYGKRKKNVTSNKIQFESSVGTGEELFNSQLQSSAHAQ